MLEQSAEVGEIGAGIPLAPNAFASIDALGVGEPARSRAVFTARLVMIDAIAGEKVATFGEAFCPRFGNLYAVIDRADIDLFLNEAVKESPLIGFTTGVPRTAWRSDRSALPYANERIMTQH